MKFNRESSFLKYIIIISLGIFFLALQSIGAEDGGLSKQPGSPASDGEVRIRAEIDKMVEMESRNPTSTQNVKERFLHFTMFLRIMLDNGRSVKEILSKQAADRIESLLRTGNNNEAVKMFHEVIIRLKQYNPSKVTNSTNEGIKIEPVVKSPAGIKEYTVDFNQEKGIFSDYLFGTLTGPKYMESGYALAKEAGFKLIEVKIDIDAINNEKMENFKKSVKSTFDIQAHPLIWFLTTKDTKPTSGVLLQNTDKVLRVINDINPTYSYVIRIGNEPDNKTYWKGTKEEFFESYAEMAKSIKEFNPKYAVGGLALMNGCSFRMEEGLDCNSLNEWLTEFLEYMKHSSIAVDYLSVHGYNAIGYKAFYKQFSLVAAVLKKYPGLSPLFGTPKLGSDEWNIMVGDAWSGSYHKQFNTAWTAAANIISWISMVDNGLWLSVRYGGTFNDTGTGGDKVKGHDFPLVHADGSKKPAFYAFKALNGLSGYTNIKVTGSDYLNFAAVAGKDNNKSVIVIMSNFDVESYLDEYPDKSSRRILSREYQAFLKEKSRVGAERFDRFNLLIRNLPWHPGDRIVYERYVADDSSNGILLVESSEMDGKSEISLSGAIKSPAVYLLKLYKK